MKAKNKLTTNDFFGENLCIRMSLMCHECEFMWEKVRTFGKMCPYAGKGESHTFITRAPCVMCVHGYYQKSGHNTSLTVTKANNQIVK